MRNSENDQLQKDKNHHNGNKKTFHTQQLNSMRGEKVNSKCACVIAIMAIIMYCKKGWCCSSWRVYYVLKTYHQQVHSLQVSRLVETFQKIPSHSHKTFCLVKSYQSVPIRGVTRMPPVQLAETHKGVPNPLCGLVPAGCRYERGWSQMFGLVVAAAEGWRLLKVDESCCCSWKLLALYRNWLKVPGSYKWREGSLIANVLAHCKSCAGIKW